MRSSSSLIQKLHHIHIHYSAYSNKDTMDPNYRFPTSTAQHYDQISPKSNKSSSSSSPTKVHPSTPTISRYYHQTPLIFPQYHQERLRTPPPRFSSSYLGPLHEHRGRFLSAWDLTAKPTMYSSSRNLVSSTPTPLSMSKQKNEHGSCILNSCVLF